MFAPADRAMFRDALVAHAHSDADIVGAALVGSGARGSEDAWSDIDLALQLSTAADESVVVERWTRWIDEQQGLSDTLDVMSAGVRYRVFLLRSSLQVDVSFWPHTHFRATEDGFRLLFGTANAPTSPPPPDLETAIGMGWLYALHARSALARGKVWQAITMLDGLRDQIFALACARHGLTAWNGREIDRLPAADLAELRASRAVDVTVAAIHQSKRLLLEQFQTEIERHDPSRAARLREPLTAMR